jgi:hypothetical protein
LYIIILFSPLEFTTKIENTDTIDVENNKSEPDVKKEEVIEREITPNDILHMPSFDNDMEPSTSGTCHQDKSIILESNQECVTLTNISFALSYQCYTHLFQI